MKKVVYLMLAAISILGYTSCTNEVDDVFDKSAAERVEASIASTKEILNAPANGWIIKFYGNLDYGGYNVLCKFDGDKVKAMSEVYGPDTTYTSHYSIEQSSGILLSFNEYNPLIHFFSDPKNPAGLGRNGVGFKGDLEFRLQEVSSDSIVMIGKKHGDRIVMVHAPQDWAAYLQSVEQVEKVMKHANYQLVIGNDTLPAKASYHNIAVTDTQTGDIIELPYTVTDKGIEIYEPTTIKGQKIKAFAYAEGSEWTETTNSDIKLIAVIPPLNETFVSGAWFITYSNLGALGQSYWDQVKAAEANIGESLLWAIFGTYTVSQQNGPKFGFAFGSTNGKSTYGGQLYFTPTMIGQDEITLKFDGSGDSNGAWYYKNAKMNLAIAPFIGTFKLTTDDVEDPSYIILTDKARPTNVIKLVAKETVYPFDN